MMMNDQRTKVFLDRYALRDTNGDPVETQPAEMWDRVANAIGETADERAAFRSLLQDFKFVPGGRILSGAGTGTEVTFYNCYVIPIETKARRSSREYPVQADLIPPRMYSDSGSDSREAILDTMSVMVDIMSRGGGVGINWSVLRPKGTHLSRVNGTTSGPISWMDVASNAVQTVTQGGSRRGAAMFMLDDWHPDVLEFIDAKRNLDKITGANVSVAISDAFMAAVDADGNWDFVFPDTTHPQYNAVWDGDLAGWRALGLPVRVLRTVRARDVWHAIAESAWHNGEPGVVFLDRYNKLSTAEALERIICVNPCGEQGLGAYSVCNLGSMNLDAYILKKKSIAPVGVEQRSFDWPKFIEDSETAVTFLDNAIDANFYFLPENEIQQKRLRRIGLGVMGLADAMLALGMRYGSKESVEFTDRIFDTLKVAALRRSCVLAQQKGAAPAWDRSMMSRPYLAQISATPLGSQIRRHGLRNLFLLTQAPTGSTSILAGVNSGIEPYFAFEYTRTDRTGTHKVYASAVEKYKDPAVHTTSEWVTAEDISVEGHIAIQAAVQRHVDSSVSKTINAPNGHTVADAEKAFTLAYKSGLKGLAYFRDGNGRDQVLTREEPKSDAVLGPELAELQRELDLLNEQLLAVVPDLIEYRRPDLLAGTTSKIQTRAGSAYVTVNRDADTGRPVEVFFNVGKAGSEVAAMAEAMGRLASLALRKGANLGGVANQLEGVGGTAQFNKSIPHSISQALTTENARTTVFPEGLPERSVSLPVESAQVETEVPESSRLELCPECDNFSLSRQEGCSKCALCGFSAC